MFILHKISLSIESDVLIIISIPLLRKQSNLRTTIFSQCLYQFRVQYVVLARWKYYIYLKFVCLLRVCGISFACWNQNSKRKYLHRDNNAAHCDLETQPVQYIEMQNYGVGAPAPAVKRRTDSYEAAQNHPHTPSSGENSRCESDDEYVNTQILRQRMQSTLLAPPATTATTTTLLTTQGHVEQPEFAGPTSSAASHNEERMRRKLQFFFMNPIEKWQARRKFPYKFVVQVKLSSHTHTSTHACVYIFAYLQASHLMSF